MKNKAPIISLSAVWRTYSTSNSPPVHALAGISLNICAGEFIAVVGPSGSGKSTLLAVAGCLDHHTNGECRFFGETFEPGDVRKRAEFRRKHVAFVFQNYKLLPQINTLENVARPLLIRGFSRQARQELAAEQLNRVGMDEYKLRRPAEMSGGQQQRVAIARALSLRPALLIADEPTGALDSTNADIVASLLKQASEEGVTVLLGTHDSNISARADRTLIMRDGEIVEQLVSNNADN